MRAMLLVAAAALVVQRVVCLQLAAPHPVPTVKIGPGVLLPMLQLGACTDCSTKAICCGSNLTASLPVWAAAQGDGVVAIDTQLRYNDTEVVARALARLGRPRDRLWITSKIDPKAYCDAPDPKAKAVQMVRETLQQLNMSHVDLLLLHEPCDRGGKPHASDQLAWEALQQAVASGWARAIGVDKFVPAQMEALRGARPAVLMAEMSMAQHDDAAIAYCQQRGIVYNAFGVMHGCAFGAPLLQQLATKYHATAAQICATWTRQRGCSMAMGLGTDASKMMAFAQADLDVFSFNMTAAEMAALNKLGSNTSHPKRTGLGKNDE